VEHQYRGPGGDGDSDGGVGQPRGARFLLSQEEAARVLGDNGRGMDPCDRRIVTAAGQGWLRTAEVRDAGEKAPPIGPAPA